jgi:hypothetical protein
MPAVLLIPTDPACPALGVLAGEVPHAASTSATSPNERAVSIVDCEDPYVPQPGRQLQQFPQLVQTAQCGGSRQALAAPRA